MSLISVIIPVYNVGRYLHRCVDSVLFQSYTDIEVILIDDGSADNCAQICDIYANNDRRVITIHQKNKGLSGARNIGISVASGDYICFVDSDDWVHPAFLSVLYEQFDGSDDIGTVACDFKKTSQEIINYKDVKEYSTKYFSGREACTSQNVNMIISVAKLYKKWLFDKIRFPIGKLHEDEFTTYKLLYASGSVCFVDEKLYFYYERPGSIMNTPTLKSWLDARDAFFEKIYFFRNQKWYDAEKKMILHMEWFINEKLRTDPSNKDIYCSDYLNLIKTSKGALSFKQRMLMYKLYLKKRLA